MTGWQVFITKVRLKHTNNISVCQPGSFSRLCFPHILTTFTLFSFSVILSFFILNLSHTFFLFLVCSLVDNPIYTVLFCEDRSPHLSQAHLNERKTRRTNRQVVSQSDRQTGRQTGELAAQDVTTSAPISFRFSHFLRWDAFCLII